MTDPLEQARTRLDRPDLALLWQTLFHRYSEGKAVSRVRLGPLDNQQRSALADLLGHIDLPEQHTTVSVAALDRVLNAAVGLDTRAVTEAICGEFGNRAEVRAAERTARAALWSWLAEHPVIRAEPGLAEWAAAARRNGLLTSVERTRTLLELALDVVAYLPADGAPLAAVAAQTCGNPHALDDGTSLSGLVLKALAAVYDVPPPAEAEQRRALWARAGVACDALSTSVLVAGLRPLGDGPIATTLTSWADAGHATAVTLAQLQYEPSLEIPAPAVWAVENPSVIAIALNRLGARCPPLVCTSGWPNTAAILLLRRLRESGARVRYHGDFDGEGIRIAAYIRDKVGADLWRMSADDYRRVVSSAGPSPGRVTEAPWDPALAPAIRGHNVSLFEEQVTDTLISDLAATNELDEADPQSASSRRSCERRLAGPPC